MKSSQGSLEDSGRTAETGVRELEGEAVVLRGAALDGSM